MKEQSFIISLRHISEYLIQEHIDWLEIPIIADDKNEIEDVQENIEVSVKVAAMLVTSIIDEFVNYESYIAEVSFSGTRYLTKDGESAFMDGTLTSEISPFIENLYNFLDESEWDTYDVKLYNKDLYITKGIDWRARKYMEMINPDTSLSNIE